MNLLNMLIRINVYQIEALMAKKLVLFSSDLDLSNIAAEALGLKHSEIVVRAYVSRKGLLITMKL